VSRTKMGYSPGQTSVKYLITNFYSAPSLSPSVIGRGWGGTSDRHDLSAVRSFCALGGKNFAEFLPKFVSRKLN